MKNYCFNAILILMSIFLVVLAGMTVYEMTIKVSAVNKEKEKQDIIPRSERIEIVSRAPNIGSHSTYIIKDKETGREYLVVATYRSIAVTPLDPKNYRKPLPKESE